MKYEDLTIHQKISLKGYIQTESSLINCRAIMLLWGYVHAINYFLDPTCLPPIDYKL